MYVCWGFLTKFWFTDCYLTNLNNINTCVCVVFTFFFLWSFYWCFYFSFDYTVLQTYVMWNLIHIFLRRQKCLSVYWIFNIEIIFYWFDFPFSFILWISLLVCSVVTFITFNFDYWTKEIQKTRNQKSFINIELNFFFLWCNSWLLCVEYINNEKNMSNTVIRLDISLRKFIYGKLKWLFVTLSDHCHWNQCIWKCTHMFCDCSVIGIISCTIFLSVCVYTEVMQVSEHDTHIWLVC